MAPNNEYVWYVCYGSNMDRERFMTYIEGGIIPGRDISELGCRDKTPPIDEKEYILPYELYFSGQSSRWENKGVAFIKDSISDDRKTYGKKYLVTIDQFIDVVCQENNIDYSSINRDDLRAAISEEKKIIFPNSKYGELLRIGYDNEIPLITFTSPSPDDEISMPSREYLKMLASGIMNTHKLSAYEIASYFMDIKGVSNNYLFEELIIICSF